MRPDRTEPAEAPFVLEQRDSQSRLEMIRESRDVGWLRRVVGWTDYPVAVRVAADLRLRKLLRERVMS